MASPARGATALLGGEGGSLSLGGYARALAGLQQLDFELAPGVPSTSFPNHDGLSSAVLRLEWKATLGDHLSAEVHERVFERLTSTTLAVGGQRMGLGASVVPARSLSLRAVAYDEPRLLLEHDLDALAVRASLGPLDVTAGRQAITWGVGGLFPVADLWTNFSPFELDTTQKRGLDALRILYSQERSLEIEVVVADRGTPKDLSGGLRVATYGAGADLYLAVAKHWRELIVFSGVSATAGAFKLRAEVAEPYDLDGGELSRVRASAGVDWLHPRLTLTLEGHLNGTGVERVSEYLPHQRSPLVRRGESYLLGRWYAGAAAVWKISDLFQLSTTAFCNLQDPSAAIAAALTYRQTQDTELSIGAYQGIGTIPLIGLQPKLRSEFGSAGGMYYIALSTFF